MVEISSESGVFEFSGGGGQKPPLGVLHVTCDAHFWTSMSYSSQKSCVKNWFELAEPFKSFRVHKQTYKQTSKKKTKKKTQTQL